MLTIIAAVARNGTIGKDNKIPWHFPEDLKRFKDLTTGHPVVMGWNTFLSILQGFKDRTGEVRLLPGRMHYVLTSKKPEEITQALADQFPNFDLGEARSVLVFCPSFGNAVQRAETGDPNVFVIGGSKVYAEALKWAGKMELTEIHADYEGDTDFPIFSSQEWDKERVVPHQPYSFVTYKRRRP